MSGIQVAVGSKNPVKLAAVRSALEIAGVEAEVIGVAVASDVPEQPIGHAETMRGAVTRARNACTAGDAAWGVGMEAGVEFDDAGQGWLYSVTVIATADGRVSHSQSGMLLLPPAVAARVRAGEELGPVMDEVTGVANSKQKLGAIGFLTGGVVRREDSFREAFGRALAPLLRPELYHSHPAQHDAGAT